MAYVSPSTRSYGEIITADIWNQDAVDNIIAIKALVDAASAMTRQATAVSATATDPYVGVTDTTAARTITLPTAWATDEGTTVIVKDESGAAATNNITIQGQAGELIDGAASAKIDSNYGALSLLSTGTAWMVTSSYGG